MSIIIGKKKSLTVPCGGGGGSGVWIMKATISECAQTERAYWLIEIQRGASHSRITSSKRSCVTVGLFPCGTAPSNLLTHARAHTHAHFLALIKACGLRVRRHRTGCTPGMERRARAFHSRCSVCNDSFLQIGKRQNTVRLCVGRRPPFQNG